MSIRNARKLRDILMVAGIMIIMLSGNNTAIILFGCFVAFACLIPEYLYNRCPNCGKRFGRSEGRFCRHCGKDVDKDAIYKR